MTFSPQHLIPQFPTDVKFKRGKKKSLILQAAYSINDFMPSLSYFVINNIFFHSILSSFLFSFLLISLSLPRAVLYFLSSGTIYNGIKDYKRNSCARTMNALIEREKEKEREREREREREFLISD